MKIFRLFTIAAAALMMSACSEDIAQMINGGKKEFTATLAAPNKGGTRTVYTEDTQNNKITVAWKVGDEIALVHNAVKDVVTVKTVNADGSATINGTITGNVSDGNDVKLVYPAAYVGTVTGGDGYGYEPNPDIEKKLLEQDGTLAYIQDNIDFREDMNTLSVKESVVTLTESADMSSSIAIWKLTLLDSNEAELKATQVKIKSGGNDLASTATIAATSEVYLAVPLVLNQTITIEATDGEDTYSFTKSGVTLNSGTYYQSTVMMEKIVDLSTVTTATTIKDGYTVTGTLGANVKISIADDATVTLDGVIINGVDDSDYSWAGITCLGDATIILKDGTTNTVKGFDANYPGIYVPSGNTLTIEGETKGTGSLTANCHDKNGGGAGIGGNSDEACGNIVIAGGTINATGGLGAGIGSANNTACGSINISGGTVTATGGNKGAGIGSGDFGTCGAITISGGSVTATGGQFGAGIGSGQGVGIQSSTDNCGAIKISGGSVKATGGYLGAGIGSGAEGNCGNILISGGTIEATGGGEGAGIGSGYSSKCVDISISGGTVTATGGGEGAGIGSGNQGKCGDILISGGTIEATGGAYAAAIGSGQYGICVNITITADVTKVTANKGSDATYSIGAGNDGTCGKVTIGCTLNSDGNPVGGTTGAISTSLYTYPAPASLITNPAVGQVIGINGKNYANAAAATADGTTAVAVIAYVGSETGGAGYTHGLAIALADEGKKNWSTAMSTCGAKTAITGAMWCLPSQDQWKQMFKANGGNDAKYTDLNTTITNAGGTPLQGDAGYWSSLERIPGDRAYLVNLDPSGSADWISGVKSSGNPVRACLAF